MKKLLQFLLTLTLALTMGQAPNLPASANLTCTITESRSGVTVTGTNSGDVICLLGNDITVQALAGDDTVIDEGTNNIVYLGEGLDIYDGSAGDGGTIDGGSGDDQITGTPGDDELSGGEGDDTLIGGDSNDTLNGGLGNDDLQGSAGNDSISGEAGEDEINGGEGDDSLNGGEEADLLIGGSGNDTMNGGLGDDELVGGVGNDEIFGESGSDTLRGREGDDVLAGGVDLDSIDGGAGTNQCDYETGEPWTSTCNYDDKGPSLDEASVSPSTFDVTDASVNLLVTLNIMDQIGFKNGELKCSQLVSGRLFTVIESQFTRTSARSLVASSTITNVTSSGLKTNLDLELSFQVRKDMFPGNYTCNVVLVDEVNQRSTHSPFTLSISRQPGEYDDAPPIVTNANISPSPVDVSESDQIVNFNFTVTDPNGMSGQFECSLNANSNWYVPVNLVWDYGTGNIRSHMGQIVSQTANRTETESIFSVNVLIPKGSFTGIYNCGGWQTDRLGNAVYQSNFTTLEITNPTGNSDVVGPIFELLSEEGQVVDTGLEKQQFTLEWKITDDSGWDWGYVACAKGNLKILDGIFNMGMVHDYGGRNISYIITGDKFLVTYEVSVDIPAGFQPGKYNCTVSGYDVHRNGNQGTLGHVTVFRTPAGQPSPPTSVSFTANRPTSGTLSWSAPNQLGNPNLYGYVAEISEDGTSWNSLPNGATTSTSLEIFNLKEGTKYWLRVRGENGGTAGQDTRFMNLNWGIVEFTTPQASVPDAPTSLQISDVQANSFKLTWTAPTYNGGRDIQDFTIEYSTNNGTTWRNAKNDKSTSLLFTVTSAAPATKYMIRIAAVNIIGSSEYLTGETTTLGTVPTEPRNLTASAITSSTLILSWQIPISNGGAGISDYKVEFSAGGTGPWTEIVHEPSNNLAFNVYSLRSNQNYRFRVSAINSVGTGPTSNVISITTLAGPPAEPTNLTVSNITSTGASLRWTAPTNTGGLRLTDYQVQLSRDGGSTWSTVPKRTSTSTALTLSGLASGTIYSVKVSGVNSSGVGHSVFGTLTTLAGLPTPPINLRSSAVTQTSAIISWDLPTSNGGSPITNYRVEISSNCSTYTVLPRTASISLAQSVSNLQPGQRYCFRVSTITAIGVSPASSVLTLTTIGNPPNAPTGLSVRVSATQVTLSWRAATVTGGGPIRNYLVEYSRDGGATWVNVTKPVSTSLTLRITGLSRSTSYLFRVFAVNDSGTSPASANLAVTTPAR